MILRSRNRFNRPVPNEHIQLTIALLEEAADSRKKTDPNGADLLYKCKHVMRMLWRELLLHDSLAEKALAHLQDVECLLSDYVERERLAAAKLALEEVRGLRIAIEQPHESWAPYDSLIFPFKVDQDNVPAPKAEPKPVAA